MFRCVLCLALCLVSAPLYAANMEITEDTVIDFSTPGMEFIHVRGDATLTVRGDLNVRVVSSIKLFDTASLVLEGGRLEKNLWFLGTEHHADFLGGRFAGESFVYGNGSGTINVRGDSQFGPWFQFSGGRQDFNIESFQNYLYQPRIQGPDVFVRMTASPVTEYGYGRFTDDVRGYYINGIGPTGSDVSVSENVNWLLYPSNGKLNGDTNNDGSVDIADLNNARNHFGTREYPGDTFPMDGIVNISDLNTIRNSFGATSLQQSVPEPSSIVMALGCIALSCTLGRCRWWQSLRRCI